MHGDAKSETFEAIGARIAMTGESLIMMGDFYAPRCEGIGDDGEPVLVTLG